MAWRDTFLRHLGPGLLSGIIAGDWVRLLRANRFSVAPSRLPKAATITGQSLQNSLLRRYEDWRFGSRVHLLPEPRLLLSPPQPLAIRISSIRVSLMPMPLHSLR